MGAVSLMWQEYQNHPYGSAWLNCTHSTGHLYVHLYLIASIQGMVFASLLGAVLFKPEYG